MTRSVLSTSFGRVGFWALVVVGLCSVPSPSYAQCYEWAPAPICWTGLCPPAGEAWAMVSDGRICMIFAVVSDAHGGCGLGIYSWGGGQWSKTVWPGFPNQAPVYIVWPYTCCYQYYSLINAVYDPTNDAALALTSHATTSPPVNYYSRTYLWDGAGWTMKQDAGPDFRESKIAADTRRNVVVLLGRDMQSWETETWEWDGSTWNQKFPPNQPPSNWYPAMAYDENRGVVVLFGGVGDGQKWDDTWEWDGTAWSLRTPSTRPPPLHEHAMAYDPSRKVTVLFGGLRSDSSASDETWEWDGTTWTQRMPSVAPPARRAHAMTYNAKRGRIVLFGGMTYTGCDPYPWCDYNDVWEYPAPLSPRVVTHPSSVNACLGSAVTFSVTAQGDPPLTYQWRKDGHDCTGATATSPSFTIDEVNYAQEGSYDVVVSNGCGSAVSQAATLTLCAGPGGCPSPADVNGDGVLDGLDIQLIVNALLLLF